MTIGLLVFMTSISLVIILPSSYRKRCETKYDLAQYNVLGTSVPRPADELSILHHPIYHPPIGAYSSLVFHAHTLYSALALLAQTRTRLALPTLAIQGINHRKAEFSQVSYFDIDGFFSMNIESKFLTLECDMPQSGKGKHWKSCHCSFSGTRKPCVSDTSFYC